MINSRRNAWRQSSPLWYLSVRKLRERWLPVFRPVAVLVILLALRPCQASGASRVGFSPAGEISEVFLVHLSHTDFGFTDQPSVTYDLHRRFLEIALETALKTAALPSGERFTWSLESLEMFSRWWQDATPQRRAQFLAMVHAGQLDVTAMPFNQTSYLDAEQWNVVEHWIPESVWSRVKPSLAMQDDVNGFPRAGALRMLDHGVHRLWMGINNDSGGAPMRTPLPFWWKMPDGRRLFVWLGLGYGSGFGFFEEEWRRGPVPSAGDTAYRPPSVGEVLPTDPEALRRTQARLRIRLNALVQSGYRYSAVLIPITNQWRIDNDPPYPPLVSFVQAWNRLGLKPVLQLTTASAGVERMERLTGPTAPEYTGEFPDWWANGPMSAPREVAASREAKRALHALESPLWGGLSQAMKTAVADVYKKLCLFDEHTWGAAVSVSEPYSFDTAGQWAEKSLLAYGPRADALWTLSRVAHAHFDQEPNGGVFLVNPTAGTADGWVEIPTAALRGDFQSVVDQTTGQCHPLDFRNGWAYWTWPKEPADLTPENTAAVFANNSPRRIARFWLEALPPHTSKPLQLSPRSCSESSVPAEMTTTSDTSGWPQSVIWKGMSVPLFSQGIGSFVSAAVTGFAPHAKAHEIWDTPDAARREALLAAVIREREADYDRVEITRTAHTVVYRQRIRHPRLGPSFRELELWNNTPHARLTLHITRLSSEDPEIFYLKFPLPVNGAAPQGTNGGVSFVPYEDQLPGTCRDYFVVDDHVEYRAASGRWLWVTRDAPLVSFGDPEPLGHRTTGRPAKTGQILANLFNNLWYTNFVADSPGLMSYRFDLMWRPEGNGSFANEAEAMSSDPLVLLRSRAGTLPAYDRWLFRP